VQVLSVKGSFDGHGGLSAAQRRPTASAGVNALPPQSVASILTALLLAFSGHLLQAPFCQHVARSLRPFLPLCQFSRGGRLRFAWSNAAGLQEASTGGWGCF
jgi:hypothetical protein